MSTSEVQGPTSMPYNDPKDQLLAPGRTRSQPIGESSQGPSYGRRTQSESSLNVPVPMPVLRSSPAADNAVSMAINMPLSSVTDVVPPLSRPQNNLPLHPLLCLQK